MNRQVQVVFALAGLWGGAFAWNRSAMPHQERIARLIHTGAPVAETSVLLSWPERVPPAETERRVIRDLFVSGGRAAPTAVIAAATSTPLPAPTPPVVRYVGFVADGAGRKVLLSGPAGIRAVAEGDLVGGGWRLERIESDRVVVRELETGIEAEVVRDR